MTTPISEDKLNALSGRVIVDVGAVSNAPPVLIGEHGPQTPPELAAHTRSRERHMASSIRPQGPPCMAVSTVSWPL